MFNVSTTHRQGARRLATATTALILAAGVLSSVGVTPAAAVTSPTSAVTSPTCNGHRATIVGTPGDDLLIGTQSVDVIIGLGGADVIKGLGGDDIICGGGGNDTIMGGAGDDTITGSGGSDTLRGGADGDSLLGGTGADTLLGQGGDDDLDGGPAADYLNGGAGINSCRGGDDPGDVIENNCDSTAPVLHSFTWDTPSVGTGSGSANVKATVDVSDDLSGMRFVQCLLDSPSGTAHEYTTGTPELLAQDGRHWTYQLTATLPQHSEQGTWSIQWCYFEDKVHNVNWLTKADMGAGGFPTTFEQLDSGDATPPALTSIEFPDPTIATGAAGAPFTALVHISEADSGIDFVQCLYRSPNGAAGVYTTGTPQLLSHNGDDWEYQLTANLPRYSEQGTWNTDWCYTKDNAGNTEWLYPAQLVSKGFPTTFDQIDPGDTATPQLTGFEFTSPSTVMTGSADAIITVTATATDDLSGLHVYMSCRYFSPDGTVPADLYGWLSDAGGTTGQYALSLTMPQYSVPGVWTLSTCMLQDKANNTAWITPSTMQTAGMPTTFTVS